MAAKRKSSGRRYGKSASKNVKTAMHKYKRGKLKAGAGRHPKAKSREQAIAIGLSEAREKGAKVPSKRTSSRKRSSSAKKSSTRKRSSSRKRASTSSRKRSSSSSRKRSSSRSS
jgi:hypothetical protein